MNLENLSDNELLNGVIKLQGNEREVTLKILFHLIEIERRKLYRSQGFSSMFDYCTRKLNYSESSAYKRITGARCVKNNPELGELFLQGKVSLSTIAKASKAFKAKEIELCQIVNKSVREVEFMISTRQPIKPREKIVPLVVEAKELPLVPAELKEERYKLQFSVTKEIYEKLNEAKNSLSNSLGSNLSIEAVFERLLINYLKPHGRKPKDFDANKRYVPRFLKKEVFKRDKGACTYVAKDGTRCCEKKYLQIDHIFPYGLGGKTELSNLRLLCKAHNLHLAEISFN